MSRQAPTYSTVMQLPPCRIGIMTKNGYVTRLDYLSDHYQLKAPQDDFTQQVIVEIENYMADANYHFTSPLLLEGTVFERRVWHALCKIAVGSTLSYGELAQQLKTSARAIGNACRKNPTAIIVPCHRIVAKGGIGGFNGRRQGKMVTVKQWLLQHEAQF